MSDLENGSQKVQPPKPKRTQKQKAQKSVKEILQRSRQKVATAEQILVSAKKSADFVKQKYKTINTALDGKETQVIEQSVLDMVSPSVKQHIEKQNVVFKHITFLHCTLLGLVKLPLVPWLCPMNSVREAHAPQIPSYKSTRNGNKAEPNHQIN